MRGTRTTAAIGAVLLAGSTLLLGACSSDGNDAASSASGDAGTSEQLGAPTDDLTDTSPRASGSTAMGQAMDSTATDPMQNGSGVKSGQQASGGLAGVTVQREVIATADMTLRSDDVDATVDTIESIAVAANGYVSARDVQSNPDDPDRTRATIVLRVPTAKLDTVIDDVKAEGDVVRVVSDEQDVTQTVIDVNSRVRSAQASVDRIRVLLSQANTIGDVVRIESELARREADLESLQAQQRALADQTALATLSVTVLAPEAVEAGPPPADDEGFVAGLTRGWNALVDVVVVGLTTVGVVLPFALAALVVALPFAAVWRRRHHEPRPAFTGASDVEG